MNPMNQFKATILRLMATFVLGFVLSPLAQAKQPSEDRGNGNSAAENVDALNLSTTGANNTAHGWSSLFSNTSGYDNTADGFHALYSNTTGLNNSAFGSRALEGNTTGSFNTAVGTGALEFNAGRFNTAVGDHALEDNSGDENTAVGLDALFFNTTGEDNSAFGVGALAFNNTSSRNTAIGHDAGLNITGNDNTCIGNNAGLALTGGDFNICIGAGVAGFAGEFNTIRIADNAPPIAGTTSKVFVGGIAGVTVGAAVVPVLVNANGQLGTVVSSVRSKKDIDPMDKTSEAIFSLRPVTFHYKGDTTNMPCFGLIAEEVGKVNSALILVDKEGKPYSVRYEQINAMLLNEFLKEHKKVEELKNEFQATIAEQRKQIQVLTAQLKEQAAQIQKVSAQLEASKPAPRVAENNQ